MSTPASTPQDSTVILGGGIIGLSTAYYLSLHRPELASSSKIHIVDSAPALHLSASAYAAGFVARDWFAAPSASLGALSFRLHKELADAHDGHRKWGFAQTIAYSLSVDEIGVGGKPTGRKLKGDDWIVGGSSRSQTAPDANLNGDSHVVKNGEGADRNEMLNDDGTPAWITKQEGGTLEVIDNEGCLQVEPKELCEFLIEEIEKRGVKIHLSSNATGIVKDNNGKISGLKLSASTGETTLPCKDIVMTSGAWTTRLFNTLFPTSKERIGIKPLAGYSIVVRSPRYSKPIIDPAKHTKDGDTGYCHSLFCTPTANWSCAPEAFSRMNKSGRPEICIAGVNDSNMPLPPDVTGVKEMFDKEKAKELQDLTLLLTGLSKEGDNLVEDDIELVREGLCMRPVSSTGVPVIAKLKDAQLGSDVGAPDDGGVYIAAGHGPWGISMSLGTGLVMSELVQGKKTSADISRLGL